MISAFLRGGLGNQMFIYAMARAMALRNNTQAVFNLSYGFKHDYQFKRKLELTCLNVQLQEKAALTFDYPFGKFAHFASRKFGRNVLAPQYQFVCEEVPFHFQEEMILPHWRNVFLEGYWQSEKYFSDYAELIRKEFEITLPMDDVIENELQEIRSGDYNLVLLGIRRYQECATLKDGVVLDEDYYNRAIQLMESKVSSPKFVVFTQQQEWAKGHIKTKSPIHFVHPKDGAFNSVKDLYLMTHCRHAIISNSSFYWWGAWLSKYHNDGIVIAPQNFLNKDSVCEKWIKI